MTYDRLWALFPPNTFVHAYHSPTDQHFVAHIHSVSYEKSRLFTEEEWEGFDYS